MIAKRTLLKVVNERRFANPRVTDDYQLNEYLPGLVLDSGCAQQINVLHNILILLL